ncbi:HNH endonuclease [Rhodanobacter ginsengiterrae]|uniref:HNH endonuclease n=1 Tax=Rhodanobacter ginsengiterrae TaxID=2008451 RepID=UPI003CE85F70
MDAHHTFEEAFPSSGNWTEEQLKLAISIYLHTPFGQLHKTNPEIVRTAALIRRTPSALAMKLSNFASLDPSIIDSGRKGLAGASAHDRKIWDAFHEDWERLALDCAALQQQLTHAMNFAPGGVRDDPADDLTDFTGETRVALVQQRVKQDFFRRTVLASYRYQCCISGVSDPRLLIASHIVPWSQDKANRLNPRNGLCLSAIHDKAFDNHLFTLSEDLRVVLSKRLKASRDDFLRDVFLPVEGQQIDLPERFRPDATLMASHRDRTLHGA